MIATLQKVSHSEIEKPACFIDVVSHNKNLVRFRFMGSGRSRFYDIKAKHWKDFRKNVKEAPFPLVGSSTFAGNIIFLVTYTKMVEFKYNGDKNGSAHHFPEEVLRSFITNIRSGQFDKIN